jgi:hypothetical protein
MNKAVVISLSIILTIFMSTSALLGQTSSRAEFEEYCKAWEGRWVSDLTWIADWPGLGKKGDKVTCYWEGRIVADGNALLGVFYGGDGMGTGITYFDPGTKQIKGAGVSSGGTVRNSVVFKKDGKWQELRTGSTPDGNKVEEKNTLTISNGGKTHTWSGTGTIGSEKMDPLRDVWRRVSK